MKPIAVALRYARALADAAGDRPAVLGKLAADLRLAAGVIERAPRLQRLLADPSVDESQKSRLLDTLVRKGKMHDLASNLLRLLVRNRRMAAIEPIATAFEAIRDEQLGVVEAETTTAVPLSAADQKRLRESLETVTGRSVRLTVSVDPALLGGVRTRIGSRVYDGSLKHHLDLLKARLAEARW